MSEAFKLDLGAPVAQAVPHNDGWLNVMTGMGTRGKDKAAHTAFAGATNLDLVTIEQIYRGDAIAAKIVDLPANEMTRAWIEVKHGDDPEAAKAIHNALEALGAQAHFKEALKWARLHGGAAIILAVDDGRRASEPVNLDAIRSVSVVSVLDRWEVYPETYYQDEKDPNYGKVETYRVVPVSATGQQTTIVHETRILRFEGVELPRRERLRNWGWGDSVLNRVYGVIRDYNGSHGTLPTIIQEFIQQIYQLRGLAQLLTQGGEDGAQKIINRLQTMQLGKSVFRAALLDENEKMERTSLTVTGLADLIDRIERRLVASTDIPHNVLLGEAPGHGKGLNSGQGQGETRTWYDQVASKQHDEMRPQLTYLLELLMRSSNGPTGGRVPEAWSFVFRALWQQDSKQQADERLAIAQADALYLDRGVLSETEVANSRFGGDGFSADTVLDKALRDGLGALEDDDDDAGADSPPGGPAKGAGAGDRETDPEEDEEAP